jgi:hypothetical protein
MQLEFTSLAMTFHVQDAQQTCRQLKREMEMRLTASDRQVSLGPSDTYSDSIDTVSFNRST